jgi:hypothetical protein
MNDSEQANDSGSSKLPCDGMQLKFNRPLRSSRKDRREINIFSLPLRGRQMKSFQLQPITKIIL